MVAVAVDDGVLVGAVGFNAARRLPAYRRRVGQPLDLDSLRADVADDEKALGVAAGLAA